MSEAVLEVRLAGVHFNGNSRASSGFVIEPGGLTGWAESPSGTDNGGQRTNAHGSYDVPMYRAARPLTLSGHVLADSPYDLEKMRDRITGLLSDGESGELVVQTVADVRRAKVRVVTARAPELDKQTASFIVQMIAADPRRYGDPNSFGPGTSLQVSHRGNTVAIPTIRVTGSMPSGYKITGPGGREYVVSQGLSSGQTHEIRFRTGWLYRNGALQRSAVSRMQTWAIPPGGRTSMGLVPVSGSGQMTVEVPDTFM